MLVIVPRIAALPAGGAEFEFGLLFGKSFWIEVSRCEDHFVVPRTKKGAGRFPHAGGDAVDVARCKIQNVYLVKGIARIAFALEDQRLAIRRKIALAAAAAFKDELPDVR